MAKLSLTHLAAYLYFLIPLLLLHEHQHMPFKFFSFLNPYPVFASDLTTQSSFDFVLSKPSLTPGYILRGTVSLLHQLPCLLIWEEEGS